MSFIDELRERAREVLEAFFRFSEKAGIYSVKMLIEVQGPRLNRVPAVAELSYESIIEEPAITVKVAGPFRGETIFQAWLNREGKAELATVAAYQSDLIEILEMLKYWLQDMTPEEEGEGR